MLLSFVFFQQSFAQYPQGFITTPQSPKPDFDSFLNGIKSWQFGDFIYNGRDMRNAQGGDFGYAYVIKEVNKFMKATIPDANQGIDFRNESTTQLGIDVRVTANYHLNGRTGAWLWDISCSFDFYSGAGGQYSYSYKVPQVTVTGNDFGDHSLYKAMRKKVTIYTLRYSYSKVLHLKKIRTGWNETALKNAYGKGLDHPLEGIYEDVNTNIYSAQGLIENRYKIGLKYIENKLYGIYLGGANLYNDWDEGELKAIFEITATPNLYKTVWFGAAKNVMEGYATFEQGVMKLVLQGEESTYVKLFPTYSSITPSTPSSPSGEWSGTGFALNNGYIITNYHVIEEATSIIVKGIKGNFSNTYNAEVVATDKYNDLALLKIIDSRFTGFGTIPYKVKTNISEVGEDVFVLGYPLTSTMGDEIKLTTGVISSKTGFQGDVSLYQISAPVQPGNSGGPLFDSKGNLIGIVNSKHTGAENVGYAIKASYLSNLVESSVSSSILPSNNTISSQPLTGKVKAVKNFVFMIECSK